MNRALLTVDVVVGALSSLLSLLRMRIEVDGVITAVDVGDCVGHVDICGLQAQFAGHGEAF